VFIVSGTVHATPSLDTFALVIALATYRVLARSASGRVQPAAGRPVAAGAVPVTAAPRFDKHASVLGRLLALLEQPAAIRPAAATSAAPAAAGRRGRIVPASLPMPGPPPVTTASFPANHPFAAVSAGESPCVIGPTPI
jgi:hypothetical protein